MPAPLPVRVVLPTYNEADNLESIAAAILAAAPAGTGILVVDDASPDGTGDIADRLAAADPRIEVLHRAGKAASVPPTSPASARARRRRDQLIVQMDADFSHDPADVPRLIADDRRTPRRRRSRARLPLRRGRRRRRLGPRPPGDLALGEHLRADLARARRSTTSPAASSASGARSSRRSGSTTVSALGYAFQIETTYRAVQAGFSVVEIPIVFSDRRVGESKMSRAIVAEAAWRVPLMRFRGSRWR